MACASIEYYKTYINIISIYLYHLIIQQYLTLSCRATPALRHWLTYRARFSLRAWPCVPFSAALSADLAFALTHSSVGCSSYRVIGWHSHHFLTHNHCPIKIIQPESLYTHDHMIKTQSFEIYFLLFEI